MKKHTWMIHGALGLVGCLWLGAGFAQAGVIFPIDPTTHALITTAGTPTVSILDSSSRDITDTWLPEPGQAVTIQLKNGSTIVTITGITLTPSDSAHPNPIANPTPLTSSAYPGMCTNMANPTSMLVNDPDFTLGGTTAAPVLTPTDCGGMAVLTINGMTYILPQDSDFDGLPDIWEAIYCKGTSAPATCLNATDDTDGGPPSNPLRGDGIAVFDEYRGFMVSPSDLRDGASFSSTAKHIRTDPKQKDLFVHLVNPQCTTKAGSTASLLGRSGVQTQIIYPTDGTSLFANLIGSRDANGNMTGGLIPGTQVHLLGYTPGATHTQTDQWVDRFDHMFVDIANQNDRIIFFKDANNVVFRNPAAPGQPPTTVPPDDRQINLNAAYPVMDVKKNSTIQKGLRLIECVDDNINPSTVGYAAYGSPNEADRAFIYTQRIVNFVNGLIAAGGTKPLQYSTSLDGGISWVAQFQGTTSPPSESDKNRIRSKAIQFYLAMELGHSVKLTPTQEGTTQKPTLYQWHHKPMGGSNLDQTIQNSTKTSYNILYIPTLYNGNDETAFIVTNK